MILLLSVAFALFAGLMMTRVFKYLHLDLPDITAYLVGGVLIGPYALGYLGISGIGFNTMEQVNTVSILSNAALGFIAFDVGNEFRLSQLRKTGKNATVIGITEGVFTALLVQGALIILHFILGEEALPLPMAVTLGAIAAATAPATTFLIVRQYHAKGPVSELLLPIVALDDGIGLLVFDISLGISQAMLGGELNFLSVVVTPFLKILFSLAFGTLMAALLTLIEKMFFSAGNRLSLAIAFVIISAAVSNYLYLELGQYIKINLSPLLVCMMLGTMYCNLSKHSADIMERSERWTPPLYTVFFVISGAQLELNVFRYPVILIIGTVYIFTRCIGKYFGPYISSRVLKCEPSVQKYLGLTLFPQAGVELGMALSAQVLGAEIGPKIHNIILFGVLVYELTGPLVTKTALVRAGEIQESKRAKKNK